MMIKRKIDTIVIHCSDTNVDKSITAHTIRKWHLDRGFDDIGYHFVIEADGCIVPGRDVLVVGAHCKGYNKRSIGICLVGGRIDNVPCLTGEWLNSAQLQSLVILVNYLRCCFPIRSIVGHNELNDKKTCPNFDVTKLKNFIYAKFQ